MSHEHAKREQAALGLEQLASLVRAQSWRATGTPSLPPTQAAILGMLFGVADGLKARGISGRLGISPASLSDSLKSLEARGWIARTPDPADRRTPSISLTATGQAMAQRLRNPLLGMGSLLQDLDEQDVGALLRIVQLLVAQAQRQGLATGLRTCLGCRFFRPYGGVPEKPHFCAFIDAPFGDPELRSDCAEQVPADESQFAESLTRFRHPLPPRAETADGARLSSDAVLPPPP